MIDGKCTRILENRNMGCHGNYAFSHIRPKRFILGGHFFALRVPRKIFETHETLSLGVQGRLNQIPV